MNRTRQVWLLTLVAVMSCVPQQQPAAPDNPSSMNTAASSTSSSSSASGSSSPQEALAPAIPASGPLTCPSGRPLDPSKPHPRVWLTPQRIAAMKRQQRANTPVWQEVSRIARSGARELPAASVAAMVYAFSGDRAAGKQAREVALALAPTFSGESSDFYRNDAQDLALIFDWVYDLLSADDKKQLITAMNRAAELDIRSRADQGTDSDVVVGGAKVNLILALATAGDNPRAVAFRDDSLARWHTGVKDWLGVRHSIKDTYLTRSAGGIWMEGNKYSPDTMRYVLELVEAERSVTGRDLLCELKRDRGVDFARETVLAATQLPMPGFQDGFTWADIESPEWPLQFERWAGLLALATDRLRGTQEGRWGQHLMLKAPTNVSDTRSPIQAVTRAYNVASHVFPFFHAEDASEDLHATPLVYVARGPGWVFARTSNDNNATGVALQAGSIHRVDHVHFDTGSFQLYRQGEWLTREARGYGLWAHLSRAHNTILLDHIGPQEKIAHVYGAGRLAADCIKPDFVFAASDATAAYNLDRQRNRGGGPADSAKEAVRQFVFHRPTGWLIIFDRLEVMKDSQTKELVFQMLSPPTLGRDSILSRSIRGSHLTGASRQEGKQQLQIKTVFPTEGLRYTLIDGQRYLSVPRPEVSVNWPAPNWEVPPSERRWHVLAKLPGKARREVALHVLTGVDAGDAHPAIAPLSNGGKKGVRIAKGGHSIEVLFNESGPVGGTFRQAGGAVSLTCN